jgi:hypothetical protein
MQIGASSGAPKNRARASASGGFGFLPRRAARSDIENMSDEAVADQLATGRVQLEPSVDAVVL